MCFVIYKDHLNAKEQFDYQQIEAANFFQS